MKQDQLYLNYKVHIGELPAFERKIKVDSIATADKERDKKLNRQNNHMHFSKFRVCQGNNKNVVKKYPEQPLPRLFIELSPAKGA